MRRARGSLCRRLALVALAAQCCLLVALRRIAEREVVAEQTSPITPSPPSAMRPSHAHPPAATDASPALVLASFKNGPKKSLGTGLRLLHSRDGRRWDALRGEPLLLPLSRTPEARVFRDPSILWHGGRFHLVWTTDLCVGQKRGQWKCEQLEPADRPLPRFGYAVSADLATWDDVRLVAVDLPGACSLWAPELSAVPAEDGGGLMLTFSATVVADRPCPVNFQKTPHRAWAVRASADMRSLSSPRRLLADVQDSVIDLFPLLNARSGGPGLPHVLFYKTEQNTCARREWTLGSEPKASEGACTLVIRQARAANATGPWTADPCARGVFFPSAISRPCAEGPAPLRLPSGETLLLFDGYRTDCPLLAPPPCDQIHSQRAAAVGLVAAPERTTGGQCSYLPARKGFGALLSRDLCEWVDVSASIDIPAEYKHGTAIDLPPEALRAVCGGRGGLFANTTVCSSWAAGRSAWSISTWLRASSLYTPSVVPTVSSEFIKSVAMLERYHGTFFVHGRG